MAMQFNNDLARERLVEVLTYHPDLGCFTWNKARGSRPAGALAGTSPGRGYSQIQIDGRVYTVQRLAHLWMLGRWPLAHVDHIDLDKLNNRWANLRECSHSQNRANVGREKRNTSGFKGVHWHSVMGAWCASIKKDGVVSKLGYFSTREAAHAAYVAKAKELFGEFARAA